jgi:hypothetical protein
VLVINMATFITITAKTNPDSVGGIFRRIT